VPGVALDGLDEVRNQVVSAFQLNVDVGPGVLGLNLEANEAVIDRDHRQDDDRNDSADDPPGGHGAILRRLGMACLEIRLDALVVLDNAAHRVLIRDGVVDAEETSPPRPVASSGQSRDQDRSLRRW
jgi:hypothetical protein